MVLLLEHDTPLRETQGKILLRIYTLQRTVVNRINKYVLDKILFIDDWLITKAILSRFNQGKKDYFNKEKNQQALERSCILSITGIFSTYWMFTFKKR